MHAGQVPLHYAPVSVGALMDPAFLRDAVHDAEGEQHHGSAPTRWRPMPRWRVAVERAIARILRR